MPVSHCQPCIQRFYAGGKCSIPVVKRISSSFAGYSILTIYENHLMDITLEALDYELALWDAPGQEDYYRLRALGYPDTHVLILCFAIDNPSSLDRTQKMVSSHNVYGHTKSLTGH